ncbi:MAG TPA: tetratricopeptide repeat protein [Blastocatellia bacterium]|nr:tetratricopeptide repeat protein [Blastocatellia bacterium]
MALEGVQLTPQEISHYRIIERLGAGGMGEVFLAQDIRLDRKVAIKMLPARSIGNQQAKKRLFREAKAAATLDHPNICSIYEVGEDADCAFIAMQYIEGRTLSRIIKDNPLPPLEVVTIGIQALEALAEAHSRGVIHRDIKPQNVIITPRGQVKILDFGLAKIVREVSSLHTGETESRLTDTGEVVGTVGYMSPEQLRDLPVDARTDLFSLGVMLYECATGKSAFVGSSKIQISLQVIEVDPQRPSTLNAHIPGELDDIILKALAKNVDARYQSADAMLTDLRQVERLLQGSVVDTRPLTLKPQTSWSATSPISLSGKVRAAPFRLKLGIVLVLLLILGIWWAIRTAGPSMPQPSSEARKWYDDGTRRMREGAFYEASKQLEQSIMYDDGFLLAHARLAQTYLELDNTDKAREELLRALSLVRDQSGVSSQDSAYVDAVAATVGQRFTKALEHYTTLFDKAQESEKAQACLDLGRAYERTENIEKAQEYYQRAIQLDGQLAAGHLRLAILYGRRQDFKNAEDEFTKAEQLYDKLFNEEGRAEVFYQRGTLVAKTNKLPEARKHLEDALDIAMKAKNEYQIVKTTLQLSALSYAQGDTKNATQLATEAINRAQNSRIQYLATGGLIDLGYALMYRGNLDDAGKQLRQALEFAERDKSRSNEARATLGLGALSRQKGNPEEAIELIEKALAFYKEAGYPKETSNALIELAGAHSDKGDVEIAMHTFEEQLQVASELGDLAQVATVHSSMGALLGVEQEKYPEALAHLDESYRINNLRGAKSRAGYNQMNRASLLYQLGRYREASDALKEASAIADQPGQPEARLKTLLAWVHVIRSQMALSEGRFADARTEGQKALELGAKQYKDIDVNAKFSIGLSEALSGALPRAKQLCEEAAAMAVESKTPRLVSSAQLALAEVLLLGKDVEGALRAALEAQPLCARSGQQDSEWRAWLMAARASHTAGRQSEAQRYASKAQSICEGLRDKWGAEAYEGYLRRPDIRIYREQIEQIMK